MSGSVASRVRKSVGRIGTFGGRPAGAVEGGGGRQWGPSKNKRLGSAAAGGGQDKDYVIAYNLTSAVQGLKANPKQGYHIKLSSDTLQAPGGSKHKVFWIKCAPKPVTTLRISKAMQGAPGPAGFAFSVSCNHR